MSIVDEILRAIPADQLAEQLGTDPQTAEAAARYAVAALVAGIQHNATDPSGQQALVGALRRHVESPLSSDSPVNLQQIDTTDGAKIVRHVFGDHEPQVIHTLASHSQALGSRGGGVSNSLIQKLLPMVAPIILAYLAKQLARQGGLGSWLGGLLAGPQQGHRSDPFGGMVGEQSGGGLVDILGGLLSGGAPTSLSDLVSDPTAFSDTASNMPVNTSDMDASTNLPASSPFTTAPVNTSQQPETVPPEPATDQRQRSEHSSSDFLDSLHNIFRGH